MKINMWNFEISFHRKPKRLYTEDELVTIKMTKDEFAKKVTGAIRNACHAHPAIPRDLIGSISKRIIGTVVGVNGIPEYMIKE